MRKDFSDDPAYGTLVRAFLQAFDDRETPGLLLTNAGTCIAANRSYRLLSRDVSGLPEPGKSLHGLLAADQVPAAHATMQAARESPHQLATLTCNFPQAPGAAHDWDLAFSVFRDTSNDPMAGILVQVKDAAGMADLEPLAHPSDAERMIRASVEAGKMALWNLCPETGEAWFSALWYRQLGYEPDAFDAKLGKWMELLHPDDRAGTLLEFQDLVAGTSDFFEADFRLRRADGSWQWTHGSGAILDRDATDEPFVVCGVQVDITDRKAAEDALALAAQTAKEHQTRLNRIADNTPVGMFEFRSWPDGTYSMPYVSASALETLGVSQADIDQDANNIHKHVSPHHRSRIREGIRNSKKTMTEFKIRYELDHPHLGSRWITAKSLPEQRPDGSVTWFGALYDITDDRSREAALQAARDKALQMTRQMEILAMQDALTGLPNRRKYDLDLERRRKSGQTKDLTLIRVDLDHFKYVNDTLGHDAGDAVLIHVSKLLQDSLAPGDTVYRIGGDEFSILLGPGGNEEIAEEVVMHIQGSLTEPFLHEGQVCRFGASFGIAVRENDEISDAELNTFADVALYEAKEGGRNRVEVFTAELHRHIIESRHLATELEEALEKGEFVPFFQPQICAKTGKLAGLETLARWHHPRHGVLAPPKFMHVAEQIRIVPLIDRCILDKSREVLAAWRANGFLPPKISFNVSSGQLQDRAILEMAKSLIDAEVQIAFELLESVLVEEETDIFRHNLDALKELGIEIEIDDFGSGHASIIGLTQTDPSVLKIDQRLVFHVADSAQSQDLITAIVGMARALSIKTTAEGVETEDQARVLSDLGCDVLQGYLFSQPLPADALFEYAMRENSSAA